MIGEKPTIYPAQIPRRAPPVVRDNPGSTVDSSHTQHPGTEIYIPRDQSPDGYYLPRDLSWDRYCTPRDPSCDRYYIPRDQYDKISRDQFQSLRFLRRNRQYGVQICEACSL